MCGFYSKFHTLSSSAKIYKNRLKFDKVTGSLKVGTFLRHSVYYIVHLCDCAGTLILQDWTMTDDIAGMDNAGLYIGGLDIAGLDIVGLDIDGLDNGGRMWR